MIPGRSPAFRAGQRAGFVVGLLICAAMTALLFALAAFAVLHAFRAL